MSLTEGGAAKGRGRGSKQNQQADDWRVAQRLYIERKGNRSIVGNVYKGKVDNVLPGLEAAFVDIGARQERLPARGRRRLPGRGGRRTAQAAGGGRGAGKGSEAAGIFLKPGQEILVQAIEDPVKTKAPRLSIQLVDRGRYLVYVPKGEGVGVRAVSRTRSATACGERSARRARRGRRDRPHRRAGAQARGLHREIKYPPKLHDVSAARETRRRRRDGVPGGRPVGPRRARHVLGRVREGVVDDEKQRHRLQSFVNRTAPELVERVEFYEGKTSRSSSRYDVEDAIHSMLIAASTCRAAAT